MMEPHNTEACESHKNAEPKMSKSTSMGAAQTSEKVQTVSGLKQELGQLRESTKDALQQSWAEVEQLKEKSAVQLQRANSLERELEILRSREQKLMRRCEEQMATIEMYKRKEEEMQAAQAAAAIEMHGKSEDESVAAASTTSSVENQQNTDPPTASGTPKKQRRSSILRSILSRRPSLSSQLSSSKISTTATQDNITVVAPEPMTAQSDSNTSSCGDEYWRKLAEEIIDSVICPSSDRMEMEAKLAQQLQKIDRDRQKEVATVIEVYQKRVNDRKKVILEQREKLSDYKRYIQGLTNELERVCNEQNDDGPNFYQR